MYTLYFLDVIVSKMREFIAARRSQPGSFRAAGSARSTRLDRYAVTPPRGRDRSRLVAEAVLVAHGGTGVSTATGVVRERATGIPCGTTSSSVTTVTELTGFPGKVYHVRPASRRQARGAFIEIGELMIELRIIPVGVQDVLPAVRPALEQTPGIAAIADATTPAEATQRLMSGDENCVFLNPHAHDWIATKQLLLTCSMKFPVCIFSDKRKIVELPKDWQERLSNYYTVPLHASRGDFLDALFYAVQGCQRYLWKLSPPHAARSDPSTDRTRRLRDLLSGCFIIDELHRFLRTLTGGEKLTGGLPGQDVPLEKYVFETVALLERTRVAMTPEFWRRLAEDRPHWQKEISRARASYQS